MATKEKSTNEKIIKPIVLKDKETGEALYTLEFTRESVVFTNRQGFKASELTDNPEEMIPILFYGAFRKNHKNISRQQTNTLLEELGGLNDEVAARLIELYSEPRQTLINEDIDYSKNSKWSVEL